MDLHFAGRQVERGEGEWYLYRPVLSKNEAMLSFEIVIPVESLGMWK